MQSGISLDYYAHGYYTPRDTVLYTACILLEDFFMVCDYAFNKGLPAVFCYRTLQKVSMY